MCHLMHLQTMYKGICHLGSRKTSQAKGYVFRLGGSLHPQRAASV